MCVCVCALLGGGYQVAINNQYLMVLDRDSNDLCSRMGGEPRVTKGQSSPIFGVRLIAQERMRCSHSPKHGEWRLPDICSCNHRFCEV